MPFKAPIYPDILTNANWQKNKGKIAKMAGETGIGDLMKKAEAAYKAVNWRKFEIDSVAAGIGNSRTFDDIEKAYADALKEGPKLKTLDDTTRKLETDSDALAKEWAKNKLIPAASTKHAQAVSAAAKKFNYAITMGTISEALKKEKQETVDGLKIVQAEHKKLYSKLVTYLDKIEKELKGVTLKTYPDVWKEYIRGVGTVLPLVAKDHAEFKAEWDVWKKYSNVYKLPGDEEELKKIAALLTKTAKVVRPKMDKVM